jgi:hypothetical protein
MQHVAKDAKIAVMTKPARQMVKVLMMARKAVVENHTWSHCAFCCVSGADAALL